MSTRSGVLSMLELKRGEGVSGEAIAREMGLSRNAVWKAVEALRAEGHRIEALGKRGYRLSEQNDILSAEGIRCGLTEFEDAEICVFSSVSSTNAKAKEMAGMGAPHGSVAVADHQSAGRGRYGRTFVSPAGCGLYMSVVLKAECLPFDDPARITSVAAALTMDAIEALTGLAPRVKWVNDLFINGKKICGILTEAVTNVESGEISSLVLGIGVNVNTPVEAFPEELRENISSIFIESGQRYSRNRLAAEILRRLLTLKDPAPALLRYRERLLYVGEHVTVHGPKGSYEALVLGLDEKCRLLVKAKDGEERALSSGEISIRIQ